jgi:carboxypeptidase C (cathepsin A)
MYPLKGKSNDSEAANDTDTALRAFVDMHPELKGRPFFVMGESYGGHYVPNTAKAVQEGNAALTPAQRAAGDAINLKGFAVGNGGGWGGGRWGGRGGRGAVLRWLGVVWGG